MSVGNINSYGDKKNNFTWQYKMLKGLDALLAAFSGSGSFIAPQSKVTTVVRVTNAGAVAVGAASISIANVGLANGTVKGVTIKPGETVTFSAGAINNTLDAIDYVATGTEFLIITVV